MIVTDTELRLRKAGIKLGARYKAGEPILRVKLTTINSGHSPGVYASSLMIGLTLCESEQSRTNQRDVAAGVPHIE